MAGRSVVRSGKIDARDRGRARGRHRSVASEVDARDSMQQWVSSEVVEGDLERLDLDEVLRATGHIPLPPEELRQLALYLAEVATPAALDRIYEAALRLAPLSHVVWYSRGLAAMAGADEPTLAKLSRRCLERASELDPDDPDVAYSLGKWHYDLGTLDDASHWFERCLALDPAHGWALLYRAHCLHDRARWLPAIDAYEAVPLGTFEGPSAWLVDVVLEALAYCRLRAGDRTGALRDFRQLVQRLETDPQRALPSRSPTSPKPAAVRCTPSSPPTANGSLA